MPIPAPGTATVLRANALSVPLAEQSVDLVVTSPPFWALRIYDDNGQAMADRIGAEGSPEEFLGALWPVMDELWRVLKPSGSAFVNLGDKFEAKRLLLLPQRFAIGCADRGWIVRQEIIWSKANGLPESVRDRCARKHETIWHFTKAERYYSDLDVLREPLAAPGRPAGRNALAGQGNGPAGGPSGWRSRNAANQPGPTGRRHTARNPRGKLPADVWNIATEPLRPPEELGVQHFAAFPTELVRRIVLGWSPLGGIVLDPFGGTGTTAAVSRALGRHGVSIDLSGDYCHLAEWRCGDRQLEKKVRQRTWPSASEQSAAQCPGQLSLLDGPGA